MSKNYLLYMANKFRVKYSSLTRQTHGSSKYSAVYFLPHSRLPGRQNVS